MEICTMDNSSSHHFHQGIDSTPMYNNDNYETIGGNEAYTNFDDVINQLPTTSNVQQQNPLQVQQPECYSSEIDDDEEDSSWKVDTMECKEEMNRLSENNVGSRYVGNNAGFENYGENSNHYDYRNSSNSVNAPQMAYREHSNNVANYSPYQLSAASKNQLPTWYHPPIPPHHYPNYDSQPQHPAHYSSNFFPQPQHHSYQANYMAPSTSTSSNTEHNMRNMIHMTANRYLLFYYLLIHQKESDAISISRQSC